MPSPHENFPHKNYRTFHQQYLSRARDEPAETPLAPARCRASLWAVTFRSITFAFYHDGAVHSLGIPFSAKGRPRLPWRHQLKAVHCCGIWSWSPMPCEKHGPRASVTTKTSTFGLGFCLLSLSGHVFHTAWETMIKSYYSTLTDWFFSFCSQKLEF